MVTLLKGIVGIGIHRGLDATVSEGIVCGASQFDGNEPTIFLERTKFHGRRNIYHNLKAFTVHSDWSNLM